MCRHQHIPVTTPLTGQLFVTKYWDVMCPFGVNFYNPSFSLGLRYTYTFMLFKVNYFKFNGAISKEIMLKPKDIQCLVFGQIYMLVQDPDT